MKAFRKCWGGSVQKYYSGNRSAVIQEFSCFLENALNFTGHCWVTMSKVYGLSPSRKCRLCPFSQKVMETGGFISSVTMVMLLWLSATSFAKCQSSSTGQRRGFLDVTGDRSRCWISFPFKRGFQWKYRRSDCSYKSDSRAWTDRTERTSRGR